MFYAKTSFKYRPSLYYPLKKQRKRQIGGCCCSPDAIPSFAAAAAANRGGHNGLLPPVMSTLPPSLPPNSSPPFLPSRPSFALPSRTTLPCLFPATSFFRPSLQPHSPSYPNLLPAFSQCQGAIQARKQVSWFRTQIAAP